jgi:hypothetical protein
MRKAHGGRVAFGLKHSPPRRLSRLGVVCESTTQFGELSHHETIILAPIVMTISKSAIQATCKDNQPNTRYTRQPAYKLGVILMMWCWSERVLKSIVRVIIQRRACISLIAHNCQCTDYDRNQYASMTKVIDRSKRIVDWHPRPVTSIRAKMAESKSKPPPKYE